MPSDSKGLLYSSITVPDLPLADGPMLVTLCPSVDDALPTLAFPIPDPSIETLDCEKDLLKRIKKTPQ